MAQGRYLPQLVQASISGCELVERGFHRDVEIAVERDVSSCVPLLVEGAYRAL